MNFFKITGLAALLMNATLAQAAPPTKPQDPEIFYIANRLEENFTPDQERIQNLFFITATEGLIVAPALISTGIKEDKATMTLSREREYERLWQEYRKQTPMIQAEASLRANANLIHRLGNGSRFSQHYDAYEAAIHHARLVREKVDELVVSLSSKTDTDVRETIVKLKSWALKQDSLNLSTDFFHYNRVLKEAFDQGLPNAQDLSLSHRIRPLYEELAQILSPLPEAKDLLTITTKEAHGLTVLLDFETRGKIYTKVKPSDLIGKSAFKASQPHASSQPVTQTLSANENSQARWKFFNDRLAKQAPSQLGKIARRTSLVLGSAALIDVGIKAVIAFSGDVDDLEAIPMFPILYYPSRELMDIGETGLLSNLESEASVSDQLLDKPVSKTHSTSPKPAQTAQRAL